MAISEKMLTRGQAVGLTPESDESPQAFGARVRKTEKETLPTPSGLARRGR
jgi:hypothetical protein